MNSTSTQPKKTNFMPRYGRKVVDAITRPVSRKVQLYTTPEYQAKLRDEKDPKSPNYKKNFVDRFVDNALKY